MKIDKQTHPEARRLVICFAGWSVSPELFRRMKTEGAQEETDLWICYDYRDLSFPEDLSKYETVRIVAWSLGVWVAEQVFHRKPDIFRRLVKSAIAVNGTGRPVDDLCGIPETLFEGTLQHLTAEGIRRFTRRMCGNRAILTDYLQIPSRPLDEISEELLFLYREIKEASAQKAKDKKIDSMESPQGMAEQADDRLNPFPWTQAIVSVDDRIFPPENLRRYWHGRCPLQEIDAPHYPFYRWKQWNELWKQ